MDHRRRGRRGPDRLGRREAGDELGQAGADTDGRYDKWADVKAAGRPWITGVEAVEVPVA